MSTAHATRLPQVEEVTAPAGYTELSNVHDVNGRRFVIAVQVHQPTHAFPGGIEVRLTEGSFDATTEEGQAAIVDAISSLQAVLDFVTTDPELPADVELAEAALIELGS